MSWLTSPRHDPAQLVGEPTVYALATDDRLCKPFLRISFGAGVDEVRIPALLARYLVMITEQCGGHRARRNHERLSQERFQHQNQDDDEDDRFDQFTES